MIKRVKKGVSRLWAMIALLSIEMVVVLALFFLALLFFIYLVRRVFFLKNNAFDQAVFDAILPYVNETNNSIMLFITFLGKHDFLIPANLLLIAYFLFIKKHKWYSIKIPAIAISSLLLMFVLKYSFGRERPAIPLLEEAKGLSFPSGHALMAVTFYGLLGYIVWQTIKNRVLKWSIIMFLILLIALIGFSRIYLRVHYTSDVIAGYCMGILWLVISITIVQRIERFSKKKVDPVVEKEPLIIET
jgi:membrane-associated phospholipid phosphatase